MYKSKQPNPFNFAGINLSNTVDYKELTKTLTQFQKIQANNIEKSPLRKPQLQLNNKNLIDLKTLQSSGLLKELNIDTEEHLPSLEVNLDDIEKVFKILDDKNNGTKLSLNELKKKIPIINPNFPESEIATLTHGKNEIKSTDLYEILKDNELDDFDPLYEAFQLLDPHKTGNVDIDKLKQIFICLGYGDINENDEKILRDCLDIDKDQVISFEDIKEIYENSKKK